MEKKKTGVCPVAGKCGGCRYTDTPYKKQLKIKQERVENLLKEYGRVKSIIGMEKSHRVVAVEGCLLENGKAGEIIGSVRELAKSFKIKAYDEDSGYGLLRHVLVRVGHATGEIMVVLVLGSPILPSKKNFM